MLFGQILGSEDFLRRALLDQECATLGLGQCRCRGRHNSYVLSTIPAAPWPPPTHIVTMPYFAFRRCISRRMVAVSFAPVQPSGWPSAIPPLLTLIFSRSRPARRITAS